MESKTLTFKQIFTIGLMLFALFLGAGNMIFPPLLGQQSGANVWIAISGFLITGVGLPLLGVIAIARSGGSLQNLGNRVHPLYGLIFTIIMYLAIGPFFGIPRTGTVAFEIGVYPFLPENWEGHRLPLLLFSFVFFALTAWLSMNPSKLVDRIGKILTPALLIILAILVAKSLATPMGQFQEPSGPYADGPFFKGFVDGYLTMDTIAALVFGIVVVSAVKERGMKSTKLLVRACIYAGLIAAVGLALVYLSLAFIGASSTEAIGIKRNGGAILSDSANYLYSYAGAVILALAIMFACITTSVGLVSSCAQYFSKLIPISYRTIVVSVSVFSAAVANFGLSQLIAISLPVLVFIYPLAIVLIILSFFNNLFGGYRAVYVGALLPTAAIGLLDGLKTAEFAIADVMIDKLGFIPLIQAGIGWFIPAAAGAAIGFLAAKLGNHQQQLQADE